MSAENQETTEEKGSNATESLETSTINYREKLATAYQFCLDLPDDIRNGITSTRENINRKLAKIPKFVIPMEHETTVDHIKRPFYQLSEACQEKAPYASALCKNHGALIIGGTSLSITSVFRLMFKNMPKKYLFWTFAASAATTAVAVELANFKWTFPKSED